MKKQQDDLIKDFTSEVDNRIPDTGIPDNRIAQSAEEIIARTLSSLPTKTMRKLLLAEHQAQASGDHRSILDPAKLVSLLEKADPAYLNSIKALVRDNVNMPAAMSELKSILNDSEKLADHILELAGIQDRRGLMNDDLKAQYPNMNKAALVKLGAENLRNMLFAFIQSQGERVDNRTNIAKLNGYMDQIAAGEKPGAEPMGDDNVIKELYIKKGPK